MASVHAHLVIVDIAKQLKLLVEIDDSQNAKRYRPGDRVEALLMPVGEPKTMVSVQARNDDATSETRILNKFKISKSDTALGLLLREFDVGFVPDIQNH